MELVSREDHLHGIFRHVSSPDRTGVKSPRDEVTRGRNRVNRKKKTTRYRDEFILDESHPGGKTLVLLETVLSTSSVTTVGSPVAYLVP